MNAIKTLLAVSALAATGAAHAAVYTFDASMNEPYNYDSGLIWQSVGIGTGSLDTSTGVLDILLAQTTTLFIGNSSFGGATYTEHDVVNGTLTGSSFLWTSGTSTRSACTPNGPFGGAVCGGSGSGTYLLAPDQNPIAFDLSYGGLTTFTTSRLASDGGVITATYTLTNTTPAVPVPAAAWLFGSGLLGLAGIARRRAA